MDLRPSVFLRRQLIIAPVLQSLLLVRLLDRIQLHPRVMMTMPIVLQQAGKAPLVRSDLVQALLRSPPVNLSSTLSHAQPYG